MKKFWKKYRGWIIVAIVAIILIACGVIRNIVSDPHFGHDHETNPHAAISVNV